MVHWGNGPLATMVKYPLYVVAPKVLATEIPLPVATVAEILEYGGTRALPQVGNCRQT